MPSLHRLALVVRNEVTATPELGISIGVLVSPAHQGLVRDMLVKLAKYMGSPLVEERIGLLENFVIVLKQSPESIDNHGSILVCPRVSSTPVVVLLTFWEVSESMPLVSTTLLKNLPTLGLESWRLMRGGVAF